MAATKKRTGNRGKRNGKGTKNESMAGNFVTEIVLIVVLACSVLILISNFGVGGVLSSAVSDFFFGLFGLMAFVFPILLFMGVAFFIVNRKNRLAKKKLLAGVVFFLFCCNLMQMLTEGYTRSYEFMEYFRNSAEYRTGGGIVGGALCVSTTLAFGAIGAYVITIVVMLITLILMTQRSFFGFLEKIGRSLFGLVRGGIENYREDAPARQARAKVRREERQQRRMERSREERTKTDLDTRPEGEGFLDGTLLRMPDEAADEPVQMEFEIHQWNEQGEVADQTVPPTPAKSRKSRKTAMTEIQADPQEREHTEEPGQENTGARRPKTSAAEIQSGIHNIKKEIENQAVSPEKNYRFPPLSLLKKSGKNSAGDSKVHLRKTAAKLQEILRSFGVNVTVVNVSCGPTVTRYELQPEQGVKVSRIVGLTDDIKLNLAAPDIRIEAPIPGKAAVGIEVPNDHNSTVMLGDLLQSEAFQKSKSKLSFAAGKDIAGQPVITDIAKMPHLLIAGATGSGKSVCINTLIMSILYKADPEEVKLIMVDPKVVELSVYNGIPHLLIPVVTDPKKAAGALNWAVAQMTERYNRFAEYNVRNLEEYNKKVREEPTVDGEETAKPLYQIVIIVDELADLMMVASGEVEDAICRLAQLARAAGIHLIIATQRPSVNVITGLIKANMPSRIAFAVSSGVDSRTILDMNGAEKLLGKGDMLFYPQGYPKPARLQGAFVSDEEVSKVVEFLSSKNPTVYDKTVEEKINAVEIAGGTGDGIDSDRDKYFEEAGRLIVEKEKASIGMLQRMFKIGFNRAARIMDQLAEAGVVGPEEGTKPRKVLMTMDEFEEYIKG
ncbi:MAG: DNA translocase FtsK [Blautia sp.]